MQIKVLISKILLVLVSLTFSLLVLEIGTRLFLKNQIDTEVFKSMLEGTSVKPLIQLSTDPLLYFELKPNLSIDFHGSSVITTPDGYRVSGEMSTVPADAIRIAVLGDSTSFGYRVNYEDSYPEKFRRQIEKDYNTPIELRNYSVPGYNSKQELRLFHEKIITYQPDLLLLHYDHNDAQPTGIGYSPTYIPPEFGDNPLNSALIKFTARKLKQLQNQYNLNFWDKHTYLNGYIVGGPLYEEHLLALEKLASETQSLHIPTVVIIFNAYVHSDKNFRKNSDYVILHANLEKKLDKMGFYVLDLYPLYQEEMQRTGLPDSSVWWIEPPGDAHPNPAGHQFIADKLIEYIRQQPDLAQIFEQ